MGVKGLESDFYSREKYSSPVYIEMFPELPQTSKMESFTTVALEKMLSGYCHKVLHF